MDWQIRCATLPATYLTVMRYTSEAQMPNSKVEFSKPSFSINSYDSDGDVYETGIYLHYDDTRIRVAKPDIEAFEKYIAYLESMVDDIAENL